MHVSDELAAFWAPGELFIVWGGTIAATLASYEPKSFFEALKGIASIYMRDNAINIKGKEEIGTLIRWAYIVQKSGMQGLENDMANTNDEFLKKGAELVATGYTGAEVKEILIESIESELARKKEIFDIVKYMSASSPAWGMVGTLMAMVIMLGSMSGDPGNIGKSMAIAFMATFYGVSTARVVLLPPAEKLKQRAMIVRFHQYVKAEGLYLIAERKSPRYIQDKLNAYMEHSEMFNIDTDMPEKP